MEMRRDAVGKRRSARAVLVGLAGVLAVMGNISVAAGADASDSDQAEGPIATDRPGNGNAATTVPATRVQVEASALLLSDGSGGARQRLVTFPTLLRVGVVPDLELRGGTGIVGAAREGPVRATDTALGAKGQLLHGAGWQPDLAVMLDVWIPTGEAEFTAGSTTPEARVASAWSLPGNLGLLLNLGADLPEASEGRELRLLYVANVGVVPPIWDERVSFFVELYGRQFIDDDAPVAQVDAGMAWLLGDDWQVDFFSQHGLTDAAPDLQLAVGVSGRF